MSRRLRRLLTVLAGAALTAPAVAHAAPALTPSVVGETPVAGGVFRFPQAVAFSPGGTVVYVADQYSGVVQAFGRDGTPRGLFGARAIRREPGRLGTVGGVATDKDGRVYVLDSENDRVQVFTPAGAPIAAWGDSAMFDLSTNPGSVTAGISASGIAVTQPAPGAAPVVYVADQGKNRVGRFALDPATLQPAGAPVFSDPALGLLHPQGVALDPGATRVYVADDDNDRVVVLRPDTLAPVAQVGSHGTGPGQFQNPYDVAVDGAGQLYVGDNLNNRVDVFDAATLGYKATFGQFGRIVGGFSIVRSVGGLADDPLGGVDVADTANNRIQALDAAGDLLAAWGIAGRGPGYVTRPGGVAFTPGGGIAVADSFDHRIERFSPDGAFAGQLGLISQFNGFATAGSAPGQFNTPRGVAFDAAGDAWVADTANNRVQEESPAGAVLATFAASAPRGIAVAADGTVFVANTGAGNVLRIAPGASTATEAVGGLTQPVAVAPDAAGGVYVADAGQVRAPDGTAVAPPAPATAWDHPSGLAFDAGSGTLYVAEDRPGTANGARIVRRSAGVWDVVATEGSGDGQVIDPGGLALSADGGTLAVADTGNDRVLRFDVPGRTPAPLPQLTVRVAPLTGGMVTSLPLGIACATDCAQHYSPGSQVTLTAQPAAGMALAGWTGACAPAGTAPACTVTMAGAQSAGAVFAVPPPPAAAPAPAQAPAPPVRIASVAIVPRRLHRARPARRGRGARRATRARVTVRTTRPASLTILVQAGRPGVRRGSACVAATRSARPRGRPCTRFVTLRGTRTVRAPAGVGRFVLTPTLAGRALAPGRYRLAVSALDTSGDRVGPTVAAFTVVR
jgi:DNA-binding beta-propeller fold protein YncE